MVMKLFERLSDIISPADMKTFPEDLIQLAITREDTSQMRIAIISGFVVLLTFHHSENRHLEPSLSHHGSNLFSFESGDVVSVREDSCIRQTIRCLKNICSISGKDVSTNHKFSA